MQPKIETSALLGALLAVAAMTGGSENHAHAFGGPDYPGMSKVLRDGRLVSKSAFRAPTAQRAKSLCRGHQKRYAKGARFRDASTTLLCYFRGKEIARRDYAGR